MRSKKSNYHRNFRFKIWRVWIWRTGAIPEERPEVGGIILAVEQVLVRIIRQETQGEDRLVLRAGSWEIGLARSVSHVRPWILREQSESGNHLRLASEMASSQRTAPPTPVVERTPPPLPGAAAVGESASLVLPEPPGAVVLRFPLRGS